MRGHFLGKGSVSTDYAPDGLRCTINIALSGEHRRFHTAGLRAPSAMAADGETSLHGIRVFMVEDEALVRLDLLDILRDAGAIIVGEAGSLQEGIDMAKLADFDVAILDRDLSGTGSTPLAELIAARGAGIVFVSGHRPDDRDQPLLDSAYMHLQKPISAQALVSTVSMVSGGAGSTHQRAALP